MERSPTRSKAGAESASRLLWVWWTLSRALKRRATPSLENEYGLRFKHLRVLTSISRGHRSVWALAEALGLPPSEVSRVLDVVSQKGLVRHELEPEELRRMTLALTPEGEAVVAGLNRSMRKLLQPELDHGPRLPRDWDERFEIASGLSEDF